jgi:hypothetical protein
VPLGIAVTVAVASVSSSRLSSVRSDAMSCSRVLESNRATRCSEENAGPPCCKSLAKCGSICEETALAFGDENRSDAHPPDDIDNKGEDEEEVLGSRDTTEEEPGLRVLVHRLREGGGNPASKGADRRWRRWESSNSDLRGSSMRKNRRKLRLCRGSLARSRIEDPGCSRATRTRHIKPRKPPISYGRVDGEGNLRSMQKGGSGPRSPRPHFTA